MPLIWSFGSALAGLVAGMIYEKENNKKIVENVSAAQDKTGLNTWDKIIMATAGVAAYWIYRSSK